MTLTADTSPPHDSTRRRSLAQLLALGAAPGLLLFGARAAWADADDAFPLGVASGCPRPDSMVLWTRLVASPSAAPLPARVPVTWELAEAAWAHSVHVQPAACHRLAQGLARGTARWNLLAQQTLMAPFSWSADDTYRTDGWSGHPAARERLLDTLAERRVANPVVLSGDVHANYIADLKRRPDDPADAMIATEFAAPRSPATAWRNRAWARRCR